ncbi:MAG: peptide deformylase [Oscillospiraceae bacterium]
MAIRNIVNEKEDILHKKCRVVEKFDEKLWTLLEDMAETMYNANGVGLAGPQVGILRQVVVIDVGDGLIELINPTIAFTSSAEVEDSEGCLSSPGEYAMVKRPKKVKVKALNRYGEDISVVGEDLLARAICHEVDHLKGIIFKDIALYMLEPDDIEDKVRGK